jgi:broad specificity phosphatase PhoE
MWATVQNQPSAAQFPGGESMTAMQARSVGAARRLDARLEAEHGAGAVGLVVSHGDIIKAILADALGMHLDLFQRINVDPASISIVRYTGTRPYVLASNTHAGDLSWLAPPAKGRRRKAAPADAAVGGGAGPSGVS